MKNSSEECNRSKVKTKAKKFENVIDSCMKTSVITQEKYYKNAVAIQTLINEIMRSIPDGPFKVQLNSNKNYIRAQDNYLKKQTCRDSANLKKYLKYITDNLNKVPCEL